MKLELPHIPSHSTNHLCLVCGELSYHGLCFPTIEKVINSDDKIVIPHFDLINEEVIYKYITYFNAPIKEHYSKLSFEKAFDYFLWTIIPIIKQTYLHELLYCPNCKGSITYNLPDCWFCGFSINVPSFNPINKIIEMLENKLKSLRLEKNEQLDIYHINISIKRKHIFPLLAVSFSIHINDNFSGKDVDLIALEQFIRSLGTNIDVKRMIIKDHEHVFSFTLDFPRNYWSLDSILGDEE